jgi:hypothetical protein
VELLIAILVLTLLAIASVVAGADSRPRLDDEPHRSI